jgi:hypothetical protein
VLGQRLLPTHRAGGAEEMNDYTAFLESKFKFSQFHGFDVAASEVNPALKPFSRDVVRWALKGGRRALFLSFGLHKSVTQIEVMRLIGTRERGFRLIVLPLGVRQEFKRDADLFFTGEHAVKLKFIRRADELEGEDTISTHAARCRRPSRPWRRPATTRRSGPT